MPSKKDIKLNLGCGYDHKKGWVNVDIDPAVKPDLIHDVTKPFPYKDHTVSEILAQDVLEHVTLEQAQVFLEECHRVLLPNGLLTIRVPDVFTIMKKYSNQPDIMMHFLYGNTEKNGVWGAHKYGYTPEIMRSIAWRHRLRISRTSTVDTNWEFQLTPSTEPLRLATVGNLPLPLKKIEKLLPWKTGKAVISTNPFSLLFYYWFNQLDVVTVWVISSTKGIFFFKPFRQLLWGIDLVITQNSLDREKTQKQLQFSHLKILTLKFNN